MLLVGYVESPVVFMAMEGRIHVSVPQWVGVVATVAWSPIIMAYEHVPGVSVFYEAQIAASKSMLTAIFGEP